MLNKNQDHNVVQSFNIIEMLPEELNTHVQIFDAPPNLSRETTKLCYFQVDK